MAKKTSEKTKTKTKTKKTISKSKKHQKEIANSDGIIESKEDSDNEECISEVEGKQKSKEPKKVFLKQWMIIAEDNKTKKRFRTFLLASCGAKAREFFNEFRSEASILNVMCTAESTKEKPWLDTNSPIQWEEFESRL